MKESILKKCILLVGPAGVGKSFLSKKVSKKTGLEVVSLDIMRHCPMKLEDIKKEQDAVVQEIENVRNRLKLATAEEREGLHEKLNRLENAKATNQQRYAMRKLLPNLPNYEKLGFDERISKFVQDRAESLGENKMVAWHFYQKYFEIEMFKAAVEEIDTPVIFDLGGGVPIALKKDYEKIYKRAKETGVKAQDLDKVFPYTPEKCESETRAMFEPFEKKNIIELTLPEDYKTLGSRASKDPLNEAFISTHQYSEIAGTKIDTTGLVEKSGANDERADTLADIIVEKCNVSVQEM